ncbi:calcium-binding protein NCSA-like isoform X2 [Mya arenaria]|uniref:calcium-binding protein NCSA-like isoform X2 n=1 Tax=Mya arenaria TaxID=6604 RepID=UPI0022E19323|nr:calcium-binding protein NCSA-like isoform X2 [Mya arenaria]
MMRGVMNRKVPKEILDLFEKYMDNKVRHLNRKDAIHMLRAEFGLDEEQASTMFDTFDKDKNGQMSIWEFQQFYVCMGTHAQEVVQKFKDIDADGSGKIDVNEAKEGLKTLKTATGRDLDPKEIEFFIETTADDDGQIDLGAFTNLLYRLKLYNAPPPPKDVKLKNPKKD